MLAAVLLALAGWIVPGEHLLAARQYDGEQVTLYGPQTRDVDDAPLELWAYSTPQPPIQANTTVHGLPAELADLTDDGEAYGRQLRWSEGGVTLALGLDGRDDARLHALAETVQPVPADRWHALRVATGPTRLTPGMKRAVVRRGSGWRLTALLPEGFPVAPEDRRAACARLQRGRARATVCDELLAWRRVGGRVFVFGTLPARVKRVRAAGVTVRTKQAPGYPLATFFAVPLPGGTCTVTVRDADRGVIGRTGPAAGGPAADRRRCLR
jgi:hypothetical protein